MNASPLDSFICSLMDDSSQSKKISAVQVVSDNAKLLAEPPTNRKLISRTKSMKLKMTTMNNRNGSPPGRFKTGESRWSTLNSGNPRCAGLTMPRRMNESAASTFPPMPEPPLHQSDNNNYNTNSNNDKVVLPSIPKLACPPPKVERCISL